MAQIDEFRAARQSGGDVAHAFNRRVLPHVARFRRLQAPDGGVVGDPDAARRALDAVAAGLRDVAHRFPGVRGTGEALTDLSAWRDAGLDRSPDFQATQRHWTPPAPGEPAVFAAPVRTPNSAGPRGYHLEALLLEGIAPRLSPPLAAALGSHRWTCGFASALAASEGYTRGQCAVLFAENVATATIPARQSFAVFLVDRFPRLYAGHTARVCDRLVHPSDRPVTHLASGDLAALRCAWLAVHDTFHNVGDRPHRVNLRSKTRTLDAIADEVKADSAAFLAFRRAGAGDEAVARVMLLDRLLRLALDPRTRTGVDARVGRAFFNVLWREEAIRARGGALRFDWARIAAVLEDVHASIVELESFADDVVYSRQLGRIAGHRLSVVPFSADDPFATVVERRFLESIEFGGTA
ncbi:DUF6421 family protein [Actinomadura flavalba]|uniref:DUF6421 family protein n=1 Tax=Actinomadura flavalba TaxID=1120938 RepID=UPI000399BFF5|nr:DUF6421 family protein [Actinomadura flavalba]